MGGVLSPDYKARDIFLIRPIRDSTPAIDAAVNAYIASREAMGNTVYNPQDHTPQNDPIGLNICGQNRQAIIDANEVHVYWIPTSEGSKFDIGMAFMANKRLKLVNNRCYIRASRESFEGFLNEMDPLICMPPAEIHQPATEDSVYIVCPSKGLSLDLQDYVAALESPDRHVYFPPRDASAWLFGVEYFKEQRAAMQKANDVRVFWTGTPIDNKFDLGMAVMAEKPIRLINDIPPTDGKKSFNNVLRALDEIYKKAS